MDTLYVVILVFGLVFLGFEIIKLLAKRSGGHKPGQ